MGEVMKDKRMYWDAYYKIVRVIDSCNTEEHLKVAYNMIQLWSKYHLQPRLEDKLPCTCPEWVSIVRHYHRREEEI